MKKESKFFQLKYKIKNNFKIKNNTFKHLIDRNIYNLLTFIN